MESLDLIPIFAITYNKDLQRNFLFELWGTLIYNGEKIGLTIFLLFNIKCDTYQHGYNYIKRSLEWCCGVELLVSSDLIPLFATTFTTEKLSFFNHYKIIPFLSGFELVTYK